MYKKNKYLSEPIRNKRYIRGIINNQIQDALHSRRTGEVTTDPEIRRQVLQKTNGMCYLCRRLYTEDINLAQRLPRLYFHDLQIDHIVAVSKFGANSVSNYLPTCGRCNRDKSNKSLAQYRRLQQGKK